ncbi:hypothetical protein LTR85_006100 [Meristemomyces frigidus]|nr:hypothetical protein LTR85_006100 [Meristemomyces frigidus]
MAKVLVFGATGVAGQFLVESLLSARSSFVSIGIFTSPNTASSKAGQIQELKDLGVAVHVGDIASEDEVLKAYENYDTIVSAVGRNAIARQTDLIRLAESSPNVTRFYPSEYGTDIEYSPGSSSEKPHQQKLAVRIFIADNVRRLVSTYIVTGPYADLYLGKMEGERAHLGSFDPQQKKAVLLGSGDEPVSFTTMPDLGKLLVASLRHPQVGRNGALKVNSFTATPHQIVAEFEKQTGAKWTVSYTPLEELKRLEQQAWQEKDPMATIYTLRRIWTEGGTLYEKRDNGLIDAEDMETLEVAVSRALQAETQGFRSGEM